MLYDGRLLAQNGWFVVRSVIPANKTGTVAEWYIEPKTVPNWTRQPVIGYSQVGYHPSQTKIAVIELDKNDTPQRLQPCIGYAGRHAGGDADRQGNAVGEDISVTTTRGSISPR